MVIFNLEHFSYAIPSLLPQFALTTVRRADTATKRSGQDLC